MKKEKIIAVKRDNLDRIVEYKTDKNKIYNYEMAKEAIISGIIENAIVTQEKDTLFYIKEKNQQTSNIPFEKMEEF